MSPVFPEMGVKAIHTGPQLMPLEEEELEGML